LAYCILSCAKVPGISYAKKKTIKNKYKFFISGYKQLLTELVVISCIESEYNERFDRFDRVMRICILASNKVIRLISDYISAAFYEGSSHKK
jgi:hypothetical protein